jgi:signal transduction histidine kinase
VQFHDGGLENERLGFDVETNLYRITQEALNNILKHAQATQADVILERRNEIIMLIIEDNGKGFDPTEATQGTAMGLVTMRERAALVNGTIEIESAPGHGTTIFVHVPDRGAGGGRRRAN